MGDGRCGLDVVPACVLRPYFVIVAIIRNKSATNGCGRDRIEGERRLHGGWDVQPRVERDEADGEVYIRAAAGQQIELLVDGNAKCVSAYVRQLVSKGDREEGRGVNDWI